MQTAWMRCLTTFTELLAQARESFRKEAYAYCVGQLIHDARKQEKITQEVLAKRVGTDKSYISKVEKGVIEPGASMFYRIIEALGMRIEIVKPIA